MTEDEAGAEMSFPKIAILSVLLGMTLALGAHVNSKPRDTRPICGSTEAEARFARGDLCRMQF